MKKRILGLMLIAGIVLALGTSAFAASATLKPTLSIKKLNDGTAGSEYSQAIKATVSSSDTSLVVSFDTTGLSDYGFTVNTPSVTATKQKEATLTLSATKLTQASRGLPIKVRATNTHSGDKYITEQTFTLKIKGNKPEITAPTETDLGTAFFTSTGIANLKRGVGVVGLDLPAKTDNNAAVTIEAKGTLPITMTATGLPDGLTAEQTAGASANSTGADDTAKLVIYGTPTEAGKFSIKVTANNEVLGSKSSTFKLTILEKPSITTTSLSDATFGKKYSFKMKADGGTSTQPLAFYATGLPSGFTISSKDGTISGTISKDTPAFSSDGTLKFSGITVGATSYASDNYPLGTYASAATGLKAEKTFSLNIKPAKPTFLSKDVYSGTFNISTDNNQNVTTALALASNKDHGIVKTTTAIKDSDGIYVFVSYPYAKLSVKDAPAGLKIDSADTTDNNQKKYAKKYIKISGTATEAGTKTMQLTATNSAGSDTLKIKFKVDAPDPTITGTGPSGAHEVDEEFTDIPFSSTQALNWKASKLPGGMTLTAATDGKSAKIAAGKYTKAQTATDYTITGTNKTTGKKAEVKGTVTVYNKPVFKTTKLGTGTTGKTYKTKVELKAKDTWISEAKLKTANGTTIYNVKGTETGVGTFQYISKDKTLSVDLTGIPTGSKIGVYFKGVNGKTNGTTVETVLSLDVKGTAPKITTTALNPSSFNKAGTYSGTIEITGTLPITTSVYIASSDVQKLGLKTTAEAIRFSSTADTTTGLKVNDAEADGKHTITLSGTVTALSMKSIPLTVEATNGASTKSAKKVLKFDINGGALAWKLTNASGKKASDDISVSGKVGSAVTGTVLYTSADKPFTVKVTGAKDGITVTSTDSNGLKTVTIGGTPTKAGKIVVTALLQNTSTKDKHQVKVTVEAAAIPVITSKDNVIMSKDFTVGKNVSMKASAKPGKNLTWSTTSVKIGNTDTTLANFGLTFDATKGTISGTALKTTSASNTYAPLIVKVKATHSDSGGESGEGEFRIGIKGAKLSLQTKTVTVGTDSDDNKIQGIAIVTKPAVTGGVTFTLDGDETDAPLTITNNKFAKNGSNFTATKGKTLKVLINNMGTISKGSIKVIAKDPTPVMSPANFQNKSLTASAEEKVENETSFTVTSSVTGDTVIKWSITRQPEGINAKIKSTNDNGTAATLTLTVPKGYKHGTDSSDAEANYDTSFTVRATNKLTGAFDSKDFTVKVITNGVWTYVKSALPENKEALPEDEELTEDEETTDEETDEVKAAEGVTLGAARTEASLTAGQRAAIEKEGYIIAAVLPEMTVAESGQYDLEVELYEKTPEGAKLVWFAFPQGVEASTDDEIAEFFDEAGADIETVPASRKIVVSPWLEAEVTYAPVIVVKAEDAEGAKDSLEGAEAGDVVTEEALAAAE